jgi:hypothetical protein
MIQRINEIVTTIVITYLIIIMEAKAAFLAATGQTAIPEE